MGTAESIAQPLATGETARAARGVVWRRVRPTADVACWIVIVISAIVLLERLRSPQTFFFDEWDFVFDRRSGGLDTLLSPHNGHLSVLPALTYRVFFHLFGLDHYRPYRVMGLLVHAAVATCVFTWTRPRVGRFAALAVGVLVLFLGAGWNDIFWPFQIGFMGSVAAGLVAWIAIERRSRRFDLVAAVSIGVALSCSGLGIAIVIGSACRLLAERAWERAVRVIAAPVALYAVWYLAYGQSQGSSDNLARLPRFVVDAGATSVAALGARDVLWGRLGIGVLLGVLVTLVVQRRGLPKSMIAPATCALANWTLIGYSRAQFGDPGASRYVYVGAVLLLLVLADIVVLWPSRLIAPIVVVAAALGVWGNWATLHASARNLQQVTLITRAELRALEWARGFPPGDYRPDESRMPQVTSGEYFAAIDSLRSPAASDAEVRGGPADARSESDRVSMQALGIHIAETAAPSFGAPLPSVSDGSRVVLAPDSCTSLNAPAGAVDLKTEIAVGGGETVAISASDAPIDVRLRRYSNDFPNSPNFSISAGASGLLMIPTDLAPTQTWIIDIRSTAEMVACNVS